MQVVYFLNKIDANKDKTQISDRILGVVCY